MTETPEPVDLAKMRRFIAWMHWDDTLTDDELRDAAPTWTGSFAYAMFGLHEQLQPMIDALQRRLFDGALWIERHAPRVHTVLVWWGDRLLAAARCVNGRSREDT